MNIDTGADRHTYIHRMYLHTYLLEESTPQAPYTHTVEYMYGSSFHHVVDSAIYIMHNTQYIHTVLTASSPSLQQHLVEQGDGSLLRYVVFTQEEFLFIQR